MNLDEFALPIKKLKGTDPVESLDFSSERLGPLSAVMIGSLIGDNASLTEARIHPPISNQHPAICPVSRYASPCR